ncbi:MAG: response regulator [Hyphomicrobiaceae bacterium]|nr:response regulator [Hyphomicrobiaceae bacterium]
MKQCMIVDDSSVIRKVAKYILTSLGYDVIEAENGREAIEKCQVRLPDAILLDWDMPDMNGQEFLTTYMHSFRSRKPYIVYATTENDPVDIARALSMGASDFMLKPFDREAIEAKFAKLPQPAL